MKSYSAFLAILLSLGLCGMLDEAPMESSLSEIERPVSYLVVAIFHHNTGHGLLIRFIYNRVIADGGLSWEFIPELDPASDPKSISFIPKRKIDIIHIYIYKC